MFSVDSYSLQIRMTIHSIQSSNFLQSYVFEILIIYEFLVSFFILLDALNLGWYIEETNQYYALIVVL